MNGQGRYSDGVDKLRETVETAGHPWIRLEFRDVGEDTETVHIQAHGVPEQNVMPILARIVKAYAAAR